MTHERGTYSERFERRVVGPRHAAVRARDETGFGVSQYRIGRADASAPTARGIAASTRVADAADAIRARVDDRERASALGIRAWTIRARRGRTVRAGRRDVERSNDFARAI